MSASESPPRSLKDSIFPGILWPQEKVSKRSLEVDLYVLINKVKSADHTSVYENYKMCVSGHVVILL